MDKPLEKSIDVQFRQWVTERELDAKAKRDGMDWVKRAVDAGSGPPQTKAFVGKLLANSTEPVVPGRTPVIREVYLTRLRKFIIWCQTPTGQQVMELPEDLDALNVTLAKFHWLDLGEAVARALEKEVEELDW